MRSLRTKITLMTVATIIIALVISTFLTVFFIRRTEQRKSDQLLLLLCETGENNLDYYFNSVQKSVRKMASAAESDLDGLDDAALKAHVERMRTYFDVTASRTNGVLTYYYRIDPEVSKAVDGFWYVDLNGTGFSEHEVTDITRFDTSDTSRLVWFTVPKQTGEAVWIPPYVTDNLDVRVISYNIPIYWRGTFVGVVGIELDYSTMAEQVDSIRLFDNGYAFLCDEEGNIFYHPRIDVTDLDDETRPETPAGVLADDSFLHYTYEGVEKTAVWLPLSNGMRLNVCAPVSETEGDWQRLILNVLIVATVVLTATSAFVMLYTRRITHPLEALTDAADKVDRGIYDFELDYDRNDEVGSLTRTFVRLADHMKAHITDLSRRANVDELTSVRNKGSYTIFLGELQERIDAADGPVEVAVGVFDCDNLKIVNDRYGHERGDVYLKTGCRLICKVFHHSPVFRIGGDEFSAVLLNEDFRDRDELARRFADEMAEISATTDNMWEQVHVSLGIADFDPRLDLTIHDTVRRADSAMYENKRARKALDGRGVRDSRSAQ